MGKAKPAKHTAAEIAAKVHAATTNMGGGKAGLADRLGGRAGHAKYQCPVCKQAAPDLKSMQAHWEARHPKDPFVADDCTDLHAASGGSTTVGVAVRGSKKKI
uniref:C2H2-type domain-containing protein n=1 Tax=Polytomella parva TaxID=51329 RepID=A0A7S0UJ91_9CHLO|mmetsp:Transcript_10406/g.19160  ORF Transcript_10406/g.19160 Transcript_10406/m.19160 type:complete len:103 (+) Transcript_10406:114-422(+)